MTKKNCQAWADSACSTENCIKWKNRGECSKNPNYMLKQCPEQCSSTSPEARRKEMERTRRILAKEDYNKATYEKHNINNRFNMAEKKYHVVWNKQPQYTALLRKRYLKEAKEITKKWTNLFNNKFGDIQDLIKFYNSQFNYIPQMNDMEKIYKEKNEHLYSKIEKDLNKSNVAKRLTNYYDNLTNVQQFVNSYLKYIYWGVLIITIVFFIFKRQFTNVYAYPFLLFCLVFPLLFLNRFVSFIYNNMNHVQIDALYITLVLAVIIMISVIFTLSNYVFKNSYQTPS